MDDGENDIELVQEAGVGAVVANAMTTFKAPALGQAPACANRCGREAASPRYNGKCLHGHRAGWIVAVVGREMVT